MMDHMKDLQSMIARYNRELMRTYEQRQLPDEPVPEQETATIPQEQPIDTALEAVDVLEAVDLPAETAPLSFAVTWEEIEEAVPETVELEEMTSEAGATAVTEPVDEPTEIPEAVIEEVDDVLSTLEEATVVAEAVDELPEIPEAVIEEVDDVLSTSEEAAVVAEAVDELPETPEAVMEEVDDVLSTLEEATIVMAEPEEDIPAAQSAPGPELHKEEQMVMSPAEPVSAAAIPVSAVSEPAADTQPLYPLEDAAAFVPADFFAAVVSAAASIPPTTEEAAPSPNQDQEGRPMEVGYIQVRTTTARGAIPVPGAYVTITSSVGNDQTVHFVALTDEDGLTPVFPIPAVSGQLSLEPGHPHPYTTYDVSVSAPGYFRVQNTGLPMFGGVHAVQPVELIPLPENSTGEEAEMVYPENGPDNLN